MPKIESREPTWAVWSNIPAAKIWEAVALSLNIEPRKVRHIGTSWMGDNHGFKERQDFEDRILVAKNAPSTAGGLPRVVVSLYDPTESKVNLAEFAQWARNLGWDHR